MVDEGCPDTDLDSIADCVDTETCDGLDNDGDGTVDEGFPDTDGDGTADCVDAETCDGIDNDGDGMVDEDFPDTDGDGIADCLDTETCDGVDNDGDGMVDEDFVDTDGDGLANCIDPDDDNDGVVDAEDADPLNPYVCRDIEYDGCDDCSVGTDGFGPLPDHDWFNDGLDTDGDGVCNDADVDDDNDGWGDNVDIDPLNPYICNDADGDGCDDCANGSGFGVEADYDPSNDGLDTDSDGLCDFGDPDDDNDGVLDEDDTDPLDPYVCQDLDGDGCDDCTNGVDGFEGAPDFNPANDGLDTDGDGLCDVGDPDDDNDGVLDEDDTDPLNPNICQDLDGDTCDDCSVGVDGFGPAPDFDPSNDGVDSDGNGICDLGESLCQDSLLLGETYPSGMTELIEVWMNITSTSSVEDGANIDYSAGIDIDLLPEFEVELGAEFHAYIEGCTAARVLSKGNKLRLEKGEAHEQIAALFLGETANVKMELFSLVTGKIDSFSYTQENVKTGKYTRTIDLSKLNAGVYIYKVTIGAETLIAKFFVE